MVESQFGNYKITDVYEDKDIKDFTPTASQKQNNVELIRIKLDAKAHKSLLNDNDALGVLGANIAYAENYYNGSKLYENRKTLFRRLKNGNEKS